MNHRRFLSRRQAYPAVTHKTSTGRDEAENELHHLRVKVKGAQSCPTLCDPVEYTVHGIVQARILEWVAFPFSSRSSQPRDRNQVSYIAGGFFTS